VSSVSVSNLNTKVVHHIREVDEGVWDESIGGSRFKAIVVSLWRTGHGRLPSFYVLVFQGPRLVGRAALWKVRNEPLPKMPALLRRSLAALVRVWPLLICRSPLAFTQGIVLADDLDPAPFFQSFRLVRWRSPAIKVFFCFVRLSKASDAQHFPQSF
jgi:hypothetical protein